MKTFWARGIVGIAAVVLLSAPAAEASTRLRTPAETVLKDGLARVASGASHSCHVRNDGTVRCWGDNNTGQLGDGSTVDRLTPVAVSGLGSVVAAVAAGSTFDGPERSHSCALLNTGSVRCWGSNAFGQLGNGTTSTVSQRTPVSVTGIANAVAIAAGGSHTCALLATGTVSCWGRNAFGQLGDSSTTNRSSPVVVGGNVNTLTNVVAIGAGAAHTCALRRDGSVRCWGDNARGQIGDGTTTNRLLPTTVLQLTNATTLAVGNRSNCAVLPDGTVRCWGDNSFRQLGNSTADNGGIVPDLSTTLITPGGIDNVVSLAGGFFHVCAIRGNGIVRCWGDNTFGQSGDLSTFDDFHKFTIVGVDNVVGLALGRSHTCLLTADGTARCLGDNGSGQLGDGTTSDSSVPTVVTDSAGSVSGRAIADGGSHSCAGRADGTVACWGENSSGQLGDGTTTRRLNPVPAAGVVNATATATGLAHTCALIGDGTVRCWGDNIFGQLGDGTTTRRTLSVATLSATNVVAVAAGDNHTCALLSDGTVRCWGSNGFGQIGDGTSLNRLTPVVVSGVTGAIAIAAGRNHTCALRIAASAAGVVRCWGLNANGQVGDGTTTQRLTSAAVLGLTNVVAIGTGANHSCAVLNDGAARCWGSNSDGQLGDTTTVDRLTPVTVSGLAAAIGIAAGDVHTCAALADGTARCWGNGASGQIGNGATEDRLVPTQVTSLTSICNPITGQCTPAVLPVAGLVQVAAGGSHSCATRSTGAVLCWGENSNGQLGDGTTTDRLRPVTVPSFLLNIDPRVRLTRKAREVVVDVIATCEAGDLLKVHVQLTQGEAKGHGQDHFHCTGALERFPVRVKAHGKRAFEPGPARAEADGVIRDGREREVQEWARNVVIAPSPKERD
jgi:alpha-tubulin suppressor-like RCC1 family protein